MAAWAKNALILVGIMGVMSVIGHYEQLAVRNDAMPAEPIIATPLETPKKNDQNDDDRFHACVKQAESNHNVSWEINCERLNEGAAERYNACVTNLVLHNRLRSPQTDCQTNCILPRDVAMTLIATRDKAMALCAKHKP